MERLDGGIGIGCIEMKQVINLTGHFWKTEVAGYSSPASPTSSSYRDAQNSEMETQAAGPYGQHTQQSPATQLCNSAAMSWTINGSVPNPSYPCQLRSSAGWSVLPYPRGDLVQKYPCHKETYVFCYYSLVAHVPVCWLTIRKQKREEKSEKRKLTVSSVQGEVSCTHTKLNHLLFIEQGYTSLIHSITPREKWNECLSYCHDKSILQKGDNFFFKQ